jgi:hypothetical protein
MEASMSSKHLHSLPAAIERAAENISPDELMMCAADRATWLARRYRNAGAGQAEIMLRIVAAVRQRQALSENVRLACQQSIVGELVGEGLPETEARNLLFVMQSTLH